MLDRDAYVLTTSSPNKQVDSDKLFEAYQVLKQTDRLLRERYELELHIVHLGGYAYEECKKLIKEQGISSVLSTIRLQEAVMPKMDDIRHRYLIVEMLRDKLMDFSPTKSLLIVDNYIFPNSPTSTEFDRNEYLQMFEDIFSPTLNKVEEIKFITKPKFNESLFTAIKELLLASNPSLTIDCKTTHDFHDRFWIVDQRKGLFVGTSLNGIGKRYALVDIIREEDVEELVRVLKHLELA